MTLIPFHTFAFFQHLETVSVTMVLEWLLILTNNLKLCQLFPSVIYWKWCQVLMLCPDLNFELGSCRWILGELSSGVYPTVSHLLVHWSKFKPVTRGEAPSIWEYSFRAARGAIHVKQIRILLLLNFIPGKSEAVLCMVFALDIIINMCFVVVFYVAHWAENSLSSLALSTVSLTSSWPSIMSLSIPLPTVPLYKSPVWISP